MAKNSTVKSAGPARVRLVVFDAVVPDGDFESLAQVLQNALKPTNGAQRQVIANGSATKTIAHQPVTEDSHEEELVEEVDEQEMEDVTPVAKAKKPRKAAPKPTVIPIDTDSEPKLSTLVDPKSNHKRYLMIAAWLHDHRNTPVITQDHIYSCFRLLGWPTDILDFAQPLRELKFKQFFTTP
ncbi:MAG: hypothetical protein ABSG88_16110 [Bradyrhizobium sp.]